MSLFYCELLYYSFENLFQSTFMKKIQLLNIFNNPIQNSFNIFRIENINFWS